MLLAAVVLRGLVPAGYMPAQGIAFAIELCRVAWPADLPADTDPEGDTHESDASFCAFASAPGAGPAPQTLAAWMPPPAAQPVIAGADVSSIPARHWRNRQARAPPAFS